MGCIDVTVVQTRGSAPREIGAQMQVHAESVEGSIGGGHLEWHAIQLARACLQNINENGLPFEKEYPLGAALGQCCGGAMKLRFSANSPERSLIAKPTKNLFLFGAGHVARALVPLLASLPLKVHWIESREAINVTQTAFPNDVGPHVGCVQSDAPEHELKAGVAGDLVLIMTHSHALDERICYSALQNPHFRYIGLIGSTTKRRLFENRLLERGISEDQWARCVCPIGAQWFANCSLKTDDQDYRKWPSVIAARVLAELTYYL